MSSWKSRQGVLMYTDVMISNDFKVSAVSCILASFHIPHVNTNWTSHNMASYLIRWNPKSSNTHKHHTASVSPVYYRRRCTNCSIIAFIGYRINWHRKGRLCFVPSGSSEAKWGRFGIKEDILASRRQRSAFQDRISKTNNVQEKTGTVRQLAYTELMALFAMELYRHFGWYNAVSTLDLDLDN